MQNLAHDVRYALRSMAKRPGFTALVVLTLAVGIGASTAMFSVLYAVLLRPLPFAQPDRLLLVRTHYEPEDNNGPSSAPDYRDLRDQTKSFQSVAAMRFVFERTVVAAGEPERLRETSVSTNLLATLGVRPWRGRFFMSGEERGHLAVISFDYWQRRFGGADDAIGKTLVIDGESDVILGVMPPRFQCLEPVDVWRPMEADRIAASPRRTHNWYAIARLRDGVSQAGADSELRVFSAGLSAQYPDSNKGVSLRAVRLQEALVSGYRTPLVVLMAAVTLVLLIACGNVAGLLLARGAARRHELAVRLSLGASPARIAAQLLTETLVLAVAGGFFGLGLSAALERLLRSQSLWSEAGVTPPGNDLRVLLFALAVSLVTALLCGIAPALAARHASPVEGLQAGSRTTDSRRGTRLRGVLVAGQIALSVALLIGSGLLLKTLSRLHGVDPGFDPTHLLTAEIALPPVSYSEPARRVQFFQSLADDLSTRPGIAAVGMINLLPIRSPANDVGVWAADNPPANRRDASVAYWRRVMPGYFAAMRIPLLAGRAIENSDYAGRSNVVVLSRSLAKLIFGERNPLGRWVVIDTMRAEPYNAEVIGVAGDEKIDGLTSTSTPAMYISYLQSPVTTMQIALRTGGNPSDASAALRSAVANLDRGVPVSGLRTMEDIIGESLGAQRFSAQLLAAFALVAVLLAAVGLYGVLAFYVSRRAAEIGVRMALGATRGRVLALVLHRGMLLTAIGLAAGVGISLWATRLLRSLLFGVTVNDMASYAGAVALLAGISALACLLPAWRASRVDPMVALRSE